MHWLKNRDGTWTVTPRNYPDGTCMNCRVRPGQLYPWGYYTCWLCAKATGQAIIAHYPWLKVIEEETGQRSRTVQ